MANSLNKITTKSILDATVATADIAADAVTGAKIADDAVGSEHIEVLDAALQFGDSVKAQFGAGNDLEIYHDGTNNQIKSAVDNQDITITSTKDLYLKTGDGATGTHTVLYAQDNAGVILKYDNSTKFETTSNGIAVGSVTIDSQYNNLKFPDDGEARFGAGEDFKFKHDGSNSYVTNNTGSLFLRSDNQIYLQDTDGNKMITCVDGGAVELYHNGDNKKIETTSTGVNVTGGIRLGGNNAANELQDYEEGTWTPTNSVGLTLTNNNPAYYIKVGKLVHIQMDISFSGASDTSQCGYVQTLPFTSENVSNHYAQGSIQHISQNGSTTYEEDQNGLLMYIAPNEARIDIVTISDGAIAPRSTMVGRRFRISMFYKSA